MAVTEGTGAAAAAVLALAACSLLWSLVSFLRRTWWKPIVLGRALRSQGIPGTTYRFLVGDLSENARVNRETWSKPMPLSHDIAARVSPLLHRSMDKYGNLSFTWVGPYPRVSIRDPELVREILSNKLGHFIRPPLSRSARLIFNGLVSHSGEKWAKHRRILNPAFHLEKLKKMVPAFSRCCNDMIERWISLTMAADGSIEIDVWPEMQKLTGDVISRTAFGSNFEEGRMIFELQAEIAQCVIKTFQFMFVPGYWYLPTANNRKMRSLDNEVSRILAGIVRKREEAMKTGTADNNDLLGLLLESNANHLDENGRPSAGLTLEEVMEECNLFYFAGMETTSVLLTWTAVLLSMHPEWQERAREEVVQVLGSNTCPDFDTVNSLKIVTMILYEVLRLYPPAAVVTRMTSKTMEIGGKTYPPEVILVLPVIFIHHDHNIWGEDVHEFNPQRFVHGVANASKHPAAFFPFGGGPRVCIGQNFAFLEAKMALSMILREFSLSLSPAYAHAPHTVFTLHPQHGAPIRLTKL